MIAPGLVLFALIQAGVYPKPVQAPSDWGKPTFLESKPKEIDPKQKVAIKKLQRRANAAGVETTITLCPVKWIGTKLAVRVLKKLYRDCPGFALVAIPEQECVIFRADAKTKKEILALLSLLIPAGPNAGATVPAPGSKTP
jgi:hypothetical protein